MGLTHGVVLALAAGGPAPIANGEREHNTWPAAVQQVLPSANAESWTGAGPFLFRNTKSGSVSSEGFRPFWVGTSGPQGDFRSGHFLYPLFSYTANASRYQWNVFELIRRSEAFGDSPRQGTGWRGDFEVWPFWFSRRTGDPAADYTALFPLAGTIKGRLGFDRLSWTLFPAFAESEKRGAVTSHSPWPIVRTTRGSAQGFALWPLFGSTTRPGVSREQFFLWPLGYDNTREPSPDDPRGSPPRRDTGLLPFYARSTGPGYVNQDFAWPFFGYTDRKSPSRYHETRYFWPWLVQGRGDERYVSRWGPFYTHSVVKGYEKKWYAWPLLRQARWTEQGIVQTKTQLLYFLYWSNEQHSAVNPNLPAAGLRHVWPIYSDWDNGAGRRQFQFPSPLEVFFPGDEKVRMAWSPLFSIFRYDQQSPGEERASFLWNAITWQRNQREARAEFHLGPLFSWSQGGPDSRIALGNGLLAWRREAAGARWRLSWFDFARR